MPAQLNPPVRSRHQLEIAVEVFPDLVPRPHRIVCDERRELVYPWLDPRPRDERRDGPLARGGRQFDWRP